MGRQGVYKDCGAWSANFFNALSFHKFMITPGRIAIGTEDNAVYILKSVGWGDKEGRDCIFSVLHRGENYASMTDNLRLRVIGNTLQEFDHHFRTEMIGSYAVRWLGDKEARKLRSENPGIDGYIKRIEEGKYVEWYLGG